MLPAIFNSRMEASFERAYAYKPAASARAPGRIEFIGNHTDYNGGLVMGVAVDRGIDVGAALRSDGVIRMATTHGEEPVAANIEDIHPLSGSSSWANYILGVIKALREHGMPMDRGLDMFVRSSLPSGAGLSSSAALELSTAWAVTSLFDYPLDKAALARVGRKAENEFVGMPCGILDQGVSAFGQKDAIVRIDCASETFSTIPMPGGLRFWVFNTMEKHKLVDSLYATRHKECMDAFALLRAAGSKAPNLASVSPREVRRSTLPVNLSMRALHVCEEHRRVIAMGEALSSGSSGEVGRLLCASHESSRCLFENSTDKLDALVEILDRCEGVMGSRLTGGGFGGAAMALALDDFSEADAQRVCDEFEKIYPGVRPSVFSATAGEGAGMIS
jgi:galactokinase